MFKIGIRYEFEPREEERGRDSVADCGDITDVIANMLEDLGDYLFEDVVVPSSAVRVGGYWLIKEISGDCNAGDVVEDEDEDEVITIFHPSTCICENIVWIYAESEADIVVFLDFLDQYFAELFGHMDNSWDMCYNAAVIIGIGR